jgi:hypothetical protein
MALDTLGTVPWAIKGELILNCNCTVFCPCVVSLGKHAPTEGYCQAWSGVRIDEGHYGDEDLSGLNVGLMLEIPGLMARGNWKAAAFIDERASEDAYEALVNIFSGKARGTTGLFGVLVSEFLGAERAPVIFETEGNARWCRCRATRARILLSPIPNTGWVPTSPSPPPPRGACAPLAGCGISTGAARKSARLIGKVRADALGGGSCAPDGAL